MSRYWVLSVFLVATIGLTGHARATVDTFDSLGVSGPTVLLLTGLGLVGVVGLIAWARRH
jgi:hypothetical protein